MTQKYNKAVNTLIESNSKPKYIKVAQCNWLMKNNPLIKGAYQPMCRAKSNKALILLPQAEG